MLWRRDAIGNVSASLCVGLWASLVVAVPVAEGRKMATSYSPKDDDVHQHRSRKPDNTAFKQQRLPAWQPILTAGTVLPAFFIIGLVFIPIGIGLFVTSNNIKELEVRPRPRWAWDCGRR